jgi:hypothetical protein
MVPISHVETKDPRGSMWQFKATKPKNICLGNKDFPPLTMVNTLTPILIMQNILMVIIFPIKGLVNGHLVNPPRVIHVMQKPSMVCKT